MKIDHIKLEGFNRFPLLDTNILEEEFTDRPVMISGINGAGKSSLVNELTPLPSNRKDFSRKGYKEITITHNSHTYTLINDFRETPVFSFLKDGEELNQANLVTTQKELVRQVFGITPVIHDILTGRENFTDMSLLARKKLFNTITNLNIDEVLKGYRSLKEEHKTQSLLLKTQYQTYKLEESKLLDEKELLSKKEERNLHKSAIDKLLQFREELQTYRNNSLTSSVLEDLLKLSTKITTFTKSNLVTLTAYPNKDLPKCKETKQLQLSLLKVALDNLYKQLENRNTELGSLANINLGSRVEALDLISKLKHSINSRLDSFTFIEPSTVNQDTYQSAYRLESSLIEVVGAIPSNPKLEGKRNYTRDVYDQRLNDKVKLIEDIQHLNAHELSIRSSIEREGKVEGKVECPSCGHLWPLKEALEEASNYREQLKLIDENRYTLTTKLSSVTKELEKIQEYFSLYQNYANLRKSTLDQLGLFWNYVDQEELIFTEPTKIEITLNSLVRELSLYHEVIELRKQLKQEEENLCKIDLLTNANVSTVKLDIQRLEVTIEEKLEEKIELEQELTTIEKVESSYLVLTEMEVKLKELGKSAKEYNLSILAKNLIEEVDDKIREHRVLLVDLETTLSQVDSIKTVLTTYQAQIDETTSNLKVLSILLEELCPKTGLIAKSISSFLNTIIYNVNATIAKIWSYKMVLVPIDVEADTLSYRFKVLIEDKLEVDDISKVSKGQAEGINLSFKLVMYKLLKLEGYPLYLDELASHMDETHSNNMVHLVQNLTTSERFSQTFLITHKENFSFLRNLQVVELS